MKELKSKFNELTDALANGLIVSCQAPATSPLSRPDIIAAFALTAVQNGAVGVRIDTPANIRAVREFVGEPVIGIYKIVTPGSEVYITPSFEAARAVAEAGADIVAIDATGRRRASEESVADLVRRVREELRLPVMADVATFEEGAAAAELGCDFIGTTLSGYTDATRHIVEPDFELVRRLHSLGKPVICEGRLRRRDQLVSAFEAGAFAVVVGNAITGTDWLVREFAEAAPRRADAGATGPAASPVS